MNLFIDTNTLLSFFHYSSDDLEQLQKLVTAIADDEVRLHLPEQVVAEFRRNREGKISDALKRLRDSYRPLQLPQLCKEYDEYAQLTRAQTEIAAAHKELLLKLEADVSRKSLRADRLVSLLFEAAASIQLSEEILQAARLRVELGSPPGKKGSLGDAVNWESLLAKVPTGADLHFVSEDGDYSSSLDSEKFDGFLLAEWRERKCSELFFYKNLSKFFQANLPDIRLSTELEKDMAIRALVRSESFQQTHDAIAKLSEYSDFTSAQLNRILSGALTNNQIYWIASDEDVASFLSSLVGANEESIDFDVLMRMWDLLPAAGIAPSDTSGSEDLPF